MQEEGVLGGHKSPRYADAAAVSLGSIDEHESVANPQTLELLERPHHSDRFLVPPGITGLWEVTARAQASFREALDMDVVYARGRALGLDFRLPFCTPLQFAGRRTTA
jgi:lipopolysaccharide/colanic/teichoic acid biosynthesis glycosyltransferase